MLLEEGGVVPPEGRPRPHLQLPQDASEAAGNVEEDRRRRPVPQPASTQESISTILFLFNIIIIIIIIITTRSNYAAERPEKDDVSEKRVDGESAHSSA